MTVCVIIVKLNESTSLPCVPGMRSCFSRIRGGQEGGGGGAESWLPLESWPGVKTRTSPRARRREELERLLVSVGRDGDPRG